MLEEFSIKKTKEAFYEFLERVRCYCKVEFAIETSRSPLIDFLLDQGYRLYWLNPNRLSSFRGRYKTSRVKDDRFDAYVLAQVLRSDKSSLPQIKPLPEEVERLKLIWKDFREGQAAAGLSPATFQSGKYRYAPFRKGCIKWARDLFTELARSTLLYQPWARLYYDRKRKEGKKHYHPLRCVANISGLRYYLNYGKTKRAMFMKSIL
ncbi:MAG: transposase [Candidatus Aminicenantes bacterium]|nr:transposase [Candidatus Aminicenantes bacterium]